MRPGSRHASPGAAYHTPPTVMSERLGAPLTTQGSQSTPRLCPGLPREEGLHSNLRPGRSWASGLGVCQDSSRGAGEHPTLPGGVHGSLGRALQVSLRGATSCSQSLLPGPSPGWGPSALQGPDDREALLNACAASQCGRRHPNKVTISGSCLCCSLWLGSGAHTRYEAGEAAPLGLQGTWGCKGAAGGVTQGLCRTLPGQAGQLGRGPCSGERCQLGRALSVVLGVDGAIRMSGQAQLRDDAGPPRCGLQGISEAAWQELVMGSFLDVPSCVRPERGEGGWTAQGPGRGAGWALSSRGPPTRRDPCASPPSPPHRPSVPGTPMVHTCCQVGYGGITAATRGLQPFIHTRTRRTHVTCGRRAARDTAGRATDHTGPPRPETKGGRARVAVRAHCPWAGSPAGSHPQAGRPWPDPAPAQGSDLVGVVV